LQLTSHVVHATMFLIAIDVLEHNSSILWDQVVVPMLGQTVKALVSLQQF